MLENKLPVYNLHNPNDLEPKIWNFMGLLRIFLMKQKGKSGSG